MELTAETAAALLDAAAAAARRAHAPYSRFAVGAAVLGESGRIHAGCNVENASYGLSICAERAAVCVAVAAGERRLCAVALVGGPAGAPAGECLPCGACRQVLAEFCAPDCPVLTAAPDGAVRRRLADLLPEPFGLPAVQREDPRPQAGG